MLETGTIVAVVTPEGTGGLAVVRLSGPDAVAIARRLLPEGSLREPVQSHRARLARVCWPEGGAAVLAPAATPAAGATVDQALVLPFLGPRSYTGEDTVEFFCHGGPVPARLVSAACRAAGARAAGPGEFTRRAFLNGRLSLTQAEAVADLVAADHTTGARAALGQLEGGMQAELRAIEAPLRALLAGLEGSLEFDEDEAAPAPTAAAVAQTLTAAREAIADLLQLAPASRRLREGVQVALVGAPNAGKSSLFNALLAHERALVDPEAGTTRDVVSAPCELGGIRFVLHDTAGLRAGAAGVEARGIARTHETAAGADVVLALSPLDGPTAADPGIQTDATVLAVATKADLAPAAAGRRRAAGDLVTSAVTGEGLDDLRAALVAAARSGGVLEAAARGVVLQARHQDRLRACDAALDGVLAAAEAGTEVQATLLGAALQELGQVTGRVFTERLLDEVFGRFCVGK